MADRALHDLATITSLTSLPVSLLIPPAEALQSHSSRIKLCFCLSQAFAFAFSSAQGMSCQVFVFAFFSTWNVLPTNIHKGCLWLSAQMSSAQWGLH